VAARAPADGLMLALRTATRDLHDQVEGRLLEEGWLDERSAYGLLVGRWLALHSHVEREFLPFGEELADLDLPGRARSGLLRTDLAALHITPPSPLPVPPLAIGDCAAALGVLYVIEGSTLGGQVIGRQLAATLQVTLESGAGSLVPYGPATRRRWQEFGWFVNGWTGDHRRVIAAARSFFECYDGWVLSDSRLVRAPRGD
jgi:heme oxygenase